MGPSPSGQAVLAVAFAVTAAVSGCGTPKSDATGKDAGRPSSAPLSAIGESAKLGGEVVARVGDASIDRATVLAVARAQKISAEAATRLLVEEALLAEGARRKGAAKEAIVKQGTTVAVANAIIARFREEARARGPITDGELATALAEGDEWMDLDRPETRRAVHALVPKDVPGGEAIARSLRDAVALAPTPETFMESARAFKNDALPPGKLVAEPLEPFTEDGRVLKHGGGNYALPFAQGAFTIPRVGDTSDVVWNPGFGWHVIRLVAINPPRHASRDELIAALEGQVIRARIGTQFEELVERLKGEARVQLLGDDATMMAPRP